MESVTGAELFDTRDVTTRHHADRAMVVRVLTEKINNKNTDNIFTYPLVVMVGEAVRTHTLPSSWHNMKRAPRGSAERTVWKFSDDHPCSLKLVAVHRQKPPEHYGLRFLREGEKREMRGRLVGVDNSKIKIQSEWFKRENLIERKKPH